MTQTNRRLSAQMCIRDRLVVFVVLQPGIIDVVDAGAVSYTHLDVYKRQGKRHVTCALSAVSAA